jgi:hypothetical protein
MKPTKIIIQKNPPKFEKISDDVTHVSWAKMIPLNKREIDCLPKNLTDLYTTFYPVVNYSFPESLKRIYIGYYPTYNYNNINDRKILHKAAGYYNGCCSECRSNEDPILFQDSVEEIFLGPYFNREIEKLPKNLKFLVMHFDDNRLDIEKIDEPIIMSGDDIYVKYKKIHKLLSTINVYDVKILIMRKFEANIIKDHNYLDFISDQFDDFCKKNKIIRAPSAEIKNNKILNKKINELNKEIVKDGDIIYIVDKLNAILKFPGNNENFYFVRCYTKKSKYVRIHSFGFLNEEFCGYNTWSNIFEPFDEKVENPFDCNTCLEHYRKNILCPERIFISKVCNKKISSIYELYFHFMGENYTVQKKMAQNFL